MTNVLAALALAAAVSMPAAAQSYDPVGNIAAAVATYDGAPTEMAALARVAHRTAGWSRYGRSPDIFVLPGAGVQVSAARAAALRACSAVAAQWPEYEWGNMEIFQYRACMAEHHQVE